MCNNVPKNLIVFCFLVVLSFCMNGCAGYTTETTWDRTGGSSHQKIYVKPVDLAFDWTTENHRELYAPGVEIDLRQAVIEKFVTTGILRPTLNESQSDLVLDIDLTKYDQTPYRFTNDNDVEESGITITCLVSLIDSATKSVYWQEVFMASDHFFAGETEGSAIQGAVEDFAEAVVERTLDDW